MAKKTTASADELVKEALLKIAGTDGAVRLSGKGDYPPVFASAAGANKEAIARLKNEGKPLVEESGSGKALQVRLTAAGFARIADSISEEKVGAVAKALAVSLPADERVAFLQDFLPKIPTAAPDLEPLLAEAVQRQAAEVEERVAAERRRAERTEASRAALERCMNHLAKLTTGRIEELTAMLRAAGGTAPHATVSQQPAPPTQTTKTKPNEPATSEDRDFRRDVAERLVSSWRDAVTMKKDEARRFLETALDNISGLRRIGEEGEQVPFDGALHENVPGVFTDHPVKIVRSGWALEDSEDRAYVIQKAQVAK